MKNILILTAFSLFLQPLSCADDELLLRAMKDELARSTDQLKLDNEAGPYYVSYRADDILSLRIAAEYGAVLLSTESRSRRARIDLRVGDYALDNSNYANTSNVSSLLSSLSSAISGMTGLPLDDDYYGIRRALWGLTDRAYKSAVETFAAKKNYLKTAPPGEEVPDFTRGTAVTYKVPSTLPNVDKDQWHLKVNQLAELLAGSPGIEQSTIKFEVNIVRSYYVNSDGTEIAEPFSTARMDISATTLSEDGMKLDNYLSYTAALPDQFPDMEELKAAIRKLASDLVDAGSGPVADSYNGPVLFAGQAAGELFRQGFSKYLLAAKTPLSDNPLISRMGENPFLNKLGLKVAPPFISIKALPSRSELGSSKLLGACTYDDEGVPCQDVELVEDGILKNLLSTRTPVEGIAESNGHSRGGGPAPSVIRVQSTNRKTLDQLKQDLVQAAQEEGLPYGYIVYGVTPTESASSSTAAILSLITQRASGEPTQFALTPPFMVYRVYPDGREEPARGLEFGSLHLNTLKNILATSDEDIIYDFRVNSSDRLATVILPSLLIGEIDLNKSRDRGLYPTKPIVSNPNR